MIEAPSDRSRRRQRRRRTGRAVQKTADDSAGEASLAARPRKRAATTATPHPVPVHTRSQNAVPATEPLYAAIDLGTNNCRLMIASLTRGQLRIVEAFSRIVRLGEDLGRTGELKAEAMDRAIAALAACAEKIKRRPGIRVRAVATQACRAARNGRSFLARVERETGLKLQLISPQEEAHLSVAGCASLLEGTAEAAMVLDVGGGSTELSWIDLKTLPEGLAEKTKGPGGRLKTGHTPRPNHWLSIPVGVVTLSEHFPEPESHTEMEGARLWYDRMVDNVRGKLIDQSVPDTLSDSFKRGQAYIIGTSGAITSLAGMHLGLERYDRNRVDGLWLEARQCRSVVERLLLMGRVGRESEPCIGRERADLVLAGAAILEAVQSLWPSERLRVADRGLREGLLLSMLKKKNRRRRGGRSRSEKTLKES